GDAKNGPTLRKLESIANLFNLRYYQFGDPNYPIPSFNRLPKNTVEKILWRRAEGAPTVQEYNKLDLKHVILETLVDFVDSSEFLPSQVFSSLPKELQSLIGSATRITGLFSNELKDNV